MEWESKSEKSKGKSRGISMNTAKVIFYIALIIYLSYMISSTLFNIDNLSDNKSIVIFIIRCLAMIAITSSFISLFTTQKEENVR